MGGVEPCLWYTSSLFLLIVMGTQCLTARGELFINIYGVELLFPNSSLPLNKKLRRSQVLWNVFKWKVIWTCLAWMSPETVITPCQGNSQNITPCSKNLTCLFYSVLRTALRGSEADAVGPLFLSTLTLLYSTDCYHEHLKFSALTWPFSFWLLEHTHPTFRTLGCWELRPAETAFNQWQRGTWGQYPSFLSPQLGVSGVCCTHSAGVLCAERSSFSHVTLNQLSPVPFHFSTQLRYPGSTFQINSLLSNPCLRASGGTQTKSPE